MSLHHPALDRVRICLEPRDLLSAAAQQTMASLTALSACADTCSQHALHALVRHLMVHVLCLNNTRPCCLLNNSSEKMSPRQGSMNSKRYQHLLLLHILLAFLEQCCMTCSFKLFTSLRHCLLTPLMSPKDRKRCLIE